MSAARPAAGLLAAGRQALCVARAVRLLGGARESHAGLPWQRGQASVELVAMLPVVAVVMLAALQLLAAGAARELAGHAAGAGAVALLERTDAREAAREAVPGWSRKRMAITVRGAAVTVRLRPPTLIPGLAALLESSVRAHAGKDA